MSGAIYYPAGIKVGTTLIKQVAEQAAENNLEDLTQYASGDSIPSWTGSKSSAPEFTQTTLDIAGVLGLCNPSAGGAAWLSKGITSGNVDMWFRQGEEAAWRWAEASAKHVVYRLISKGMLYWSQLQVQQNNEATLSYTVCAAYDPANAILTLLNDQAIDTTPVVDGLYTLGPVRINGVEVAGLQSMNWQNNVEIEKIASSGEPGPSLLTGKTCRPVVAFEGMDLKQGQSYGQAGYALAIGSGGLAVYLRRRAHHGINVADATTSHIGLFASLGTVKWRRTGGERGMGSYEIHLERASAGNLPFTVQTGIAIPA